jgi:hypothetical protein
MKPVLMIVLLAVVASACGIRRSTSASGKTGSGNQATALTDDEKHRLYTAALAASESPLDTDLFKEVCKTIGIFDTNGVPNDNYLPFVSAHIDWAMKPETDQLRREINTKEKAKDYVAWHLPH